MLLFVLPSSAGTMDDSAHITFLVDDDLRTIVITHPYFHLTVSKTLCVRNSAEPCIDIGSLNELANVTLGSWGGFSHQDAPTSFLEVLNQVMEASVAKKADLVWKDNEDCRPLYATRLRQQMQPGGYAGCQDAAVTWNDAGNVAISVWHHDFIWLVPLQ